MSRLDYVRLSEDGTGRWRMEYHFQDERPPEYHGDHPSEESLEADLSFHGWTRAFGPGGQEIWLPPRITGPLYPVAAQSVDLRGTEPLVDFEEFSVVMSFHHTLHPRIGTCWGFSYRLARYVVPGIEASVTALIDPILGVLTGGLFDIECIGHFITQESAKRAGKVLYEKVKAQLGDELLEVAIKLQLSVLHKPQNRRGLCDKLN